MVVITRRDGPPITVPPGLRSFSAALMGFMETAQRQTELGLLDEWIIGNRHRSPRTSRTTVDQHGLRFAFYGRTSTIGHQDRTSSQGWQREVADSVVAGHGGVVVEFFDAGCSRRLSWSSRPEAAALLAELSSADRRFDAVVIGEYERAFYGEQFARVAALLDCFGVQVWLPESGGPVHLADPCIGRWSRCWVRSPSGRFCALGTGCWPRCAPRPGSRAGIWAGGRRMVIGWSTLVRIPIVRTRVGGVGCAGWTRIR